MFNIDIFDCIVTAHDCISHISADFFLLLFVSLQWRVFYQENQSNAEDYGGGDNKSVIEDVENNVTNPVEDFLSYKE